ncbi:MAG: hypothetical protein J6C98_07585, partial [Oscillospiraceae bacterium]|nr:hypothetical protein [Oscillospiraceae bacterium]
MAETYCGKFCAECSKKEELNCSGCKSGPGSQFGGDCELAKCVRDKGHETCDTCGFKGNCGTLRSRDNMPDYRRRKMEAEEMRKAAIAKRAPVLGKWLWIIFWLIIPSSIGSLMSNESTVKILPALFMPGQIINAICSLTYGAILLKLGSEENRYRTAGICALIAGASSALAAIVNGGSDGATWILIFTIPAAIVALVGEYNEYMAHSAVLSGVDNELSEKWEVLWKWYIGLFLGMFGCIIVMLIIPILGALAILGCAIGTVVVSILKLIYLYR